jgi:biotin-(acetyl-CoA carboxylase) ligase
MPSEQLEQIDQPATSLAQLSGQPWNLKEILQALLDQFLEDFSLLQTQGFAYFLPVYENFLAFKKQQITCHDGLQYIKGICHSLSPDGRLNLELPEGRIVLISSGEIVPQSVH